MNNYFYIGGENSQKINDEKEEIEKNNDKFDKELKKLNERFRSWYLWKFSRR